MAMATAGLVSGNSSFLRSAFFLSRYRPTLTWLLPLKAIVNAAPVKIYRSRPPLP